MRLILLPLSFLFLLSLVKNEITMDRDTIHGHDSEYFTKTIHQKSNQNDGHIYVHMIPHSHDDVGWLKNPDQYFSGTESNTL